MLTLHNQFLHLSADVSGRYDSPDNCCDVLGMKKTGFARDSIVIYTLFSVAPVDRFFLTTVCVSTTIITYCISRHPWRQRHSGLFAGNHLAIQTVAYVGWEGGMEILSENSNLSGDLLRWLTILIVFIDYLWIAQEHQNLVLYHSQNYGNSALKNDKMQLRNRLSGIPFQR